MPSPTKAKISLLIFLIFLLALILFLILFYSLSSSSSSSSSGGNPFAGQCGRRLLPNVRQGVIGGVDASGGEYPWHADFGKSSIPIWPFNAIDDDRKVRTVGANFGHFGTSIILFPTSEGVSKMSERVKEWAQRRARAKRAVRSKRASERCERTSERTSEWPNTYVPNLGCSAPLWCGLFRFLYSWQFWAVH